MKFGVVNKSITVIRFVLHILHRNITHLAIITLETKQFGILKGGNWKRAVTKCFMSEIKNFLGTGGLYDHDFHDYFC